MRGMSWLCLLDLRQLDHGAGFADIAAGGRENGDQGAIPLPEVYTYVFRIPGYDSHPIHTDRESRILTHRQYRILFPGCDRTVLLA